MLFGDSIDVKEEGIRVYDKTLLKTLLFDRTTRGNILWATDNYISYGSDYSSECPILPKQITGKNENLIQPRAAKSKELQSSRTRDKAEVFTPSWICNEQNNLVDERWFGYGSVFNTSEAQSWIPNSDPIRFPDDPAKTWKQYVDIKRLEISCGEAPYLVSRYDTVTGLEIPINSRIGLLDRKLRVVNENTKSREDWLFWAFRAFQSVYGYEYQGDNLLLARENLLLTFVDYYQNRFSETPERELQLKAARIISWNIWQMDGMKYVVPLSCHLEEKEQFAFSEIIPTETRECPGCAHDNPYEHNGIYCRIYDWRRKFSLPFITMTKGAKA